ncbi:MAG: hypothetical protein DMF50_00005, partial [Acidobacteria bacterium]
MAVRKLATDQPAVKPEIFLTLYEKMLRAYFVEEQCRVFVRAGKCSFYASARGHEKLQIAMAMLLRPGKDWFFPYYREKALMIGLGMPLDQVFQGMLSRQGDPNSAGRNMSEHFSSRALRVVSPTACTGTEFLIAVGMAKAVKADRGDEVVYVSGGEGSTSEGEFFEAVNKAQRDLLPVLFVIQNNGYAISVPQEQQTHSQLYEVARGFGMKSLRVDGTRFSDMYTTLKPLIAEMRRGAGPLFVEAMVVRLDSHSSSDDQAKYRDAHDMEEARRKDPMLHSEMRIREMLLTDAEIATWRARVKAEVEAAARAIDELPYPDPATATNDIFAPDRVITEEAEPSPLSDKPITMVEA